MPSLQDALKSALAQPKPPLPLDDWEADEKQIINAKTQEKTMPNNAPIVNLVKAPNAPRPRFGITNNASRETFNYVRDNPGKTRGEVSAALQTKGFKRSSVESLLSQLVRTNQLAKDADGKLTALHAEYTPILPKQLKALRKESKAAALRAIKTAALTKAREAKAAIAAKRAEATTKEEPKQKYQPKAVPEGIAALQTTPTSLPLVELTADKILDTLGVRQAKLLFLELKKIFEE